jgi:signal transduction histidine kinase/BarA-like signal transduction histidine kinase
MLREVENLTGLRFELAHDQNTIWRIAMSMLENGEVSMISGIIRSNARQDSFFWAETPIMTDYYALISKSDYRDISLNEILYVKIGVINRTSYAEEFSRWFPDHKNTVAYQDTTSAIDALERGEVDMLMANEGHLLLIANYRELTGYKVNIIFNNTFDSNFGFNRNEAVLCSIVNKALHLINTGRIADQWRNKTYDYRIKVVQARMPWIISSFALLLSAFALVAVLFIISRRAGKQLHESAYKAEAASRAKGTFLAHMSHEIRTPLNAIIGMAYIVKDCVADNEKALRGINQIMTSSHHLLGILNDILDMSKIESGKLELAHEPFSLLAACNEVADIMTHRCVEKSITFVTNKNEIKDITLLGDKLRLNQVLINLLGNAVKFTGTNGRIVFFTEILEEGPEKAQIKFSISDNGIGMSEKQLKKLFIPFEQADSTIAARFGGTGLGLSLSQNFIKMMGGKINVTSEINRGSTFDFSLYFDIGELPVSQAADEKYEDVNLSGKRLLLTEDIEINRLIVCELLSSSGLSIEEAENGRKAVEAFDSSPEGYYDIILMDVQMPVLDGYEAAREIRALTRADAKTVPIIAMTAHAYKEDVEQALAAGMNGHLAKPIDRLALMETVGKILKSKEG